MLWERQESSCRLQTQDQRGGVQYVFNQFDTDWITEIRSFSN